MQPPSMLFGSIVRTPLTIINLFIRKGTSVWYNLVTYERILHIVILALMIAQSLSQSLSSKCKNLADRLIDYPINDMAVQGT